MARVMADETQRVAKTVGGIEEEEMLANSFDVTESARALQTTAQVRTLQEPKNEKDHRLYLQSVPSKVLQLLVD